MELVCWVWLLNKPISKEAILVTCHLHIVNTEFASLRDISPSFYHKGALIIIVHPVDLLGIAVTWLAMI